MACLPKSYDCEHQVTNPFVEYLNCLRNTSFIHVSCLDKVRRSVKKTPSTPDVLYRDEQTGQPLVIEHKSLIWPPELAKRHQNDHYLVDELLLLLEPEIVDGPFALELPHLLDASKNEIKAFAKDIATTIAKAKDSLLSGTIISSSKAGRCWRISQVNLYDIRSLEAGIFFPMSPLDEKNSSRTRIPRAKVLSELLSNAAKKFVTYGNAQRIVRLEVIGETALTFRMGKLLKRETVPEGIDEVWIALYDYFDDDTEGWIYEIEWPSIEAAASP